MSLDPGPLGVLAARLMELLEDEYGARGDGATIRAAMVLVDVSVYEDDGAWTHTRWQFASASDGWDPDISSSAYAAGVVAQAFTGLTEGSTPP